MKQILFFTVAMFAVSACSNKQSSQRETQSLNGEWKFATDSASLDAGRKVQVPHTWNMEEDLQEYYGTGWYARNFDVPKSWKNKQIELIFDAVYHDAWIYVNGQLAGEHIGSGYNRFAIDITRLAKPGNNSLVVKANNEFSRNNIPFISSFDWNNDGGIVRDVNLLATNKEGAVKKVKVSGAPNLTTGNSGTVHISIDMYAGYPGYETVLEGEIKEWKTGKSVWKGKLEKNNSLPVSGIKFWHFDQPNLYTLTVNTYSETDSDNGVCMSKKLTDSYTTRFGFRSIEMTPTHFVLNGEPVRLMGVEWMPGSSMVNGMAETKEELFRNLTLMKEANCVYSRFHWQQDQAIYDWCDENGILYQEEVPAWGGETIFNDTIIALGKMHLREMIEYHYNHPCIIAWGIGNELRSNAKDVLDGLAEWRRYAKELDSTRLITYVSNHVEWEKEYDKAPDEAAYTLSDGIMFNEYLSTWYGRSVADVPAALDRIKANYPGKALIIAEWGICEPPHLGGDPRRVAEMQQQIKIYGSKPFIAGAIYFSINDYRTFIGPEFGIESKRVHGVYDVRMNKKPSYEILKKISSPIEAEVKTAGDKKQITLKANTGVPSYTLYDYKVVYGSQEQTIAELKPGESVTLTFYPDAVASPFIVYRPTGFEVMKVE